MLLRRELTAVLETGTGRFVLVRGRRRVGKSRLITEFLARSDVPSVYFTATQQQPSGELAAFAAGIERIGAWRDRTGRDEVGLVGTGTDPSSGVTLVGSIKWRQRRRFSADDLAELKRHAGVVPGAGAATRLVVASRTGSDVEGVDLVLGPPDLLI